MARKPVHPGEILSEELDELAISPTEMARQLAVPPNRVFQILKGQRSITGDTALRLGHWFGMNPQFWLNLQGQFDLAIAKERAGQSIAELPTQKKHVTQSA